MILLVDQDGPLADFERAYHERWPAKHPEKLYVPREQRNVWSIEDQYPPEMRETLRDLFKEPGFYTALHPVPGAIEAMHEAVSLGIQVLVCTAPMRGHNTCAQEKIGWLAKHLGQSFADDAIITRDKTLVHGDVLIDDKPKITGRRATPSWKHLLFDVPYTRGLVGHDRIDWSNWRAVLKV